MSKYIGFGSHPIVDQRRSRQACTNAKTRQGINWLHAQFQCTVKPVLSGHSKIDKTQILMANGSLMKVESIAECSHWSILQYFLPALSDNRSENPFFGIFLNGCLRQVLL